MTDISMVPAKDKTTRIEGFPICEVLIIVCEKLTGNLPLCKPNACLDNDFWDAQSTDWCEED